MHCDIKLAFVFSFSFHELHFLTTLRMLKPVLYFHMASFNYGVNRVNGVDTSCRCDEINIIPDLIFSVNITQCIITGCVFSGCVFVFRGAQFSHYYISGLWETWSYNGLRQIRLKWGFSFGALCVDSKQQIKFRGSSAL